MTPGTVSVLNVGAGDTKLVFDPNNEVDKIRAARIVTDMLKRGYALLIKVDDKWVRATAFDETKCEYLIADFDPGAAKPEPTIVTAEGQTLPLDPQDTTTTAEDMKAHDIGPSKPGRRGSRRVPAAGTAAVAVSRTAGGSTPPPARRLQRPQKGAGRAR